MAKGRVTEKSLKIGQTVYVLLHLDTNKKKIIDTKIFGKIERCVKEWSIEPYAITENYEKCIVLGEYEYKFYSKSKAKTKMNKLNEGLK